MSHTVHYGRQPYSMAVIHGGPGAAGYLSPLAERISSLSGTIEPYLVAESVEGQLRELFSILTDEIKFPVVLVGHSWGAWLSYIFTARFPHLVSKLVLIGAGSFDEKYNIDIASIRLERLSSEEQSEVATLSEQLNTQKVKMTPEHMRRFGELTRKADSYDADELFPEKTEYHPGVYRKVWVEASSLRKSGELLRLGRLITCPVLAIHGIYDPHPAGGVEYPLRKTLSSFEFILLDNCGHYPWIERQARDEFYNKLLAFIQY